MSPIVLVRGIVFPTKYFDDGGAWYITKANALEACADLVGKPVSVDFDPALVLGKVVSAWLDDKGNMVADLMLGHKDASKYALSGEYRELALGMKFSWASFDGMTEVALVRASKLEGSPIQEVKVVSLC